MSISMQNFYQVNKVNNIYDVFSLFPIDGEGRVHADEHNWLFLSTSGVHGTYHTLSDGCEGWEEDGVEYPAKITVLVVRPRTVCVWYGHVEFDERHMPHLSRLVSETLGAIRDSQFANL